MDAVEVSPDVARQVTRGSARARCTQQDKRDVAEERAWRIKQRGGFGVGRRKVEVLGIEARVVLEGT
jgi:hypothetical protein